MDEIRVVVTMDCEPTTATTDPSATGPKDWFAGERAVRGYADISRAYGFPVTYFIHPETALAQAGVFNDLAANGACLGLHMHPWKYALWRYGGRRFMAHYGGLTEDELGAGAHAARNARDLDRGGTRSASRQRGVPPGARHA
jgi:hypothetical protein